MSANGQGLQRFSDRPRSADLDDGIDMANCNDVISLAREPEALKALAGYS
jgi:hypothetical protein